MRCLIVRPITSIWILFCLKKAVETARAIALHYNAGFVVLDAEHQIARVVFSNATVDFAQQIGPTIYSDLHRRDFTINAIAYNPHSETLLDPLDGCADLERRVLCMIAPENLKDDPLRLLRAYRQAAQLGFGLDGETKAIIRSLAPYLKTVAAERVRGRNRLPAEPAPGDSPAPTSLGRRCSDYLAAPGGSWPNSPTAGH